MWNMEGKWGVSTLGRKDRQKDSRKGWKQGNRKQQREK